MDDLYRELHRWKALPFVWGQSDCVLVLADYLVRLGHPDTAAHLRGMYDSAASCHRLTGWLRDPVNVAESCTSRIPLVRTTNPVKGDIGIVRVRLGRDQKIVGAVFLGKNWAIHGEDGLIIGAINEVLAAWRVTHA